MRTFLLALILVFISSNFCHGQFGDYKLYSVFGMNFSKYNGKGADGNYFTPKFPGYQIELTLNNQNGIEFVFPGISISRMENVVNNVSTLTKFWTIYSEVHLYNPDRVNPLMLLIGYDFVRMKPEDYTTDPENQHHLALGAAWNLKLGDATYLQFKFKPYYVINNSMGQKFGYTTMLNLHIGFPGTDL